MSPRNNKGQFVSEEQFEEGGPTEPLHDPPEVEIEIPAPKRTRTIPPSAIAAREYDTHCKLAAKLENEIRRHNTRVQEIQAEIAAHEAACDELPDPVRRLLYLMRGGTNG